MGWESICSQNPSLVGKMTSPSEHSSEGKNGDGNDKVRGTVMIFVRVEENPGKSLLQWLPNLRSLPNTYPKSGTLTNSPEYWVQVYF